jgi:hypothetical protein
MADQYDNTNDGVAFPPFEDMKMILQGKINVEGRDSRYAIVRRETKAGKEIMEVYEKWASCLSKSKAKRDRLTTQAPSTIPMTRRSLGL